MITDKEFELPNPPKSPTGTEAAVDELGEDEAILNLARNAIAGSTRAVYARALRGFERWCKERNAVVVPAEPTLVAGFIAHRVSLGTSFAALRVDLGAIRAAHLDRQVAAPTDHPLVRQVMRGASRTTADRRVDRRKRPLEARFELDRVIERIEAHDLNDEIDGASVPSLPVDPILELVGADDVIDELEASGVGGRPIDRAGSRRAAVEREVRKRKRAALSAHRDRAMILLGFAGALRRSEIAALEIGDLRWESEGLVLHIRRSKTDQEAKGRLVAILPGQRRCPVEALRSWLQAADIHRGPVFRRITRGAVVREEGLTGASVARVVKERVAAAGLDPERFSGHSLRAGFLTSAAKANASLWKMMDHAGQKTVDVMRAYVRDRELFENHAGKGLL